VQTGRWSTHEVQFASGGDASDLVLGGDGDGEHHVGARRVLVHVGAGLGPVPIRYRQEVDHLCVGRDGDLGQAGDEVALRALLDLQPESN
jgi:hypothetical protein